MSAPEFDSTDNSLISRVSAGSEAVYEARAKQQLEADINREKDRELEIQLAVSFNNLAEAITESRNPKKRIGAKIATLLFKKPRIEPVIFTRMIEGEFPNEEYYNVSSILDGMPQTGTSVEDPSILNGWVVGYRLSSLLTGTSRPVMDATGHVAIFRAATNPETQVSAYEKVFEAHVKDGQVGRLSVHSAEYDSGTEVSYAAIVISKAATEALRN